MWCINYLDAIQSEYFNSITTASFTLRHLPLRISFSFNLHFLPLLVRSTKKVEVLPRIDASNMHKVITNEIKITRLHFLPRRIRQPWEHPPPIVLVSPTYFLADTYYRVLEHATKALLPPFCRGDSFWSKIVRGQN